MHPLSWTDANGNIHVGSAVRLHQAVTGTGLKHTILHEMMHSFFRWYPPSQECRAAFGNQADWRSEQTFSRMLNPLDDSEYVSRYAMTHAEEDLVETAASILEGLTVPDSRKRDRVLEWFEEMSAAEF